MQQPDNKKQVDAVLIKELQSSLSGVEVILQFHRSLLQELQEAVKYWSTSTKLGEIFNGMVFK